MQQTKQRGSKQSIQLVLNLYTLFGYKFIYYFMYPITFFYFLIASNVKKSLKNYYKHLNVEFTSKVYYDHLRMFAVSMVDRFISKIHPEHYDFRYESNEVPVNTLASGAVLVYSHFGGWAASSMGSHVENKINIVMQETMLGDIKRLETNLEQKLEVNVIDIHKGTIAVSVEIANALMNEEIVVIMADRVANEKAESEVLFLGEKAKFNKNPFQVAYKVDKPLLAYFIIWTDVQQYKVEYIHIVMDKNKIETEAVTEALETYVKKFEEIVRLYPNQWFNLYDFWEKK
jgi:predicted LPLAT superfamily acyltransferase